MSQSLCFNDFTFSPVTRDNQPWFKSSELARALGYANDNYVTRLYRRNEDEFSSDMTQLIENSAEIQFGSEGRARIFSLRGCHLLAMFARTPVAKAFRRWVLDVIEQYGDRVPVEQPVTLNDELISAAERAELKLIVDAKLSTYPAAVQGKARAEIWAKFNRHFRIAEYKQLPARLMPEAREFLLSVRVRAINAIPTAESAIPYPPLSASSVYADRIAALDRLEEEWIEFAGETRSRLHRFVNELLRVKESTYPELLNRVCPRQNISKDPLLGILQSNSYNAQTWIDAGISEMRAAIRAAKTANRMMLG
jgi:prophage antirepressor-like protein